MLQNIQANCRVEGTALDHTAVTARTNYGVIDMEQHGLAGAEAAPLLESGNQVIMPHLRLFLEDCQDGVPLTLIMEVKDKLVTKCWCGISVFGVHDQLSWSISRDTTQRAPCRFHYDEADVTELYIEAGHTLAPKSMQG